MCRWQCHGTRLTTLTENYVVSATKALLIFKALLIRLCAICAVLVFSWMWRFNNSQNLLVYWSPKNRFHAVLQYVCNVIFNTDWRQRCGLFYAVMLLQIVGIIWLLHGSLLDLYAVDITTSAFSRIRTVPWNPWKVLEKWNCISRSWNPLKMYVFRGK